jgi:hypothetical protein
MSQSTRIDSGGRSIDADDDDDDADDDDDL